MSWGRRGATGRVVAIMAAGISSSRRCGQQAGRREGNTHNKARHVAQRMATSMAATPTPARASHLEQATQDGAPSYQTWMHWIRRRCTSRSFRPASPTRTPRVSPSAFSGLASRAPSLWAQILVFLDLRWAPARGTQNFLLASPAALLLPKMGPKREDDRPLPQRGPPPRLHHGRPAFS